MLSKYSSSLFLVIKAKNLLADLDVVRTVEGVKGTELTLASRAEWGLAEDDSK